MSKSGGDPLKILSNVLFWLGFAALVPGIILLEVGTRYMREGKNVRRKKLDKVAVRFMIISGVLFLLSYLFSL